VPLDRSWPFVGVAAAADCGDKRDGEKCVWVCGEEMVVLRAMLSVSMSGAEGGGGRLERREVVCGGRMEARQRKHSPVP